MTDNPIFAVAAKAQALQARGADVVASPGRPGHAEVVTAADGVAVPVATDNEFRISAEALDNCRTPRTRAVILSSPGNPTGAVHPESHLRQIADWAQRHGIWVVSDDIYRAFGYTGIYRSICGWLRSSVAVPSSWAECPRSTP